jgi:hypothetical protein
MRYNEPRPVWTSLGTHDKPGTLTQGGALFSLEHSSRLGIEPKTPGWLVQAQPGATSPSGDLIPTIRGSGAHPGRCGVCVFCGRCVC